MSRHLHTFRPHHEQIPTLLCRPALEVFKKAKVQDNQNCHWRPSRRFRLSIRRPALTCKFKLFSYFLHAYFRLSKLNDDLAPPGVDDAPSIFQPVSTIDPVTGQLRGSNGRLRESKDRRSPVSGYRRRRRDSRSPVHRTKRRSPSPYRRPTASRRERPRREKTPPRKKHER